MALQPDVLRASLDLVLERKPDLTHRFYEILFERYPEVRPLFGSRSEAAQEQMLGQALVAVVDHLEEPAWLTDTLRGLGARHRDYGVTDRMYPWVGECLLATLSEVAAEHWTPGLEAQWTEAYGAIVGLMTSE